MAEINHIVCDSCVTKMVGWHFLGTLRQVVQQFASNPPLMSWCELEGLSHWQSHSNLIPLAPNLQAFKGVFCFGPTIGTNWFFMYED